MPLAKCPLCSAETSSLEAHLRAELSYTRWRCRFCPVAFFDLHQAQDHFDPEFSTHQGRELTLLETLDKPLERRLRELLGSAKAETGEKGSLKAPSPARSAQSPLGAPSQPSSDSFRPDVSVDSKPSEEELLETSSQSLKELTGRAAAETEEEEGAEEEEEERQDQLLREAPREPLSVAAESFLGVPSYAPADLKPGLSSASWTEGAPASGARIFGRRAKATSGDPCTDCGDVVSYVQNSRLRHVAAKHFNRTMFSCSLCGWETVRLQVELTRAHVAKAHPAAGPKPWTDHRPAHAADLRRLTKTCFP